MDNWLDFNSNLFLLSSDSGMTSALSWLFSKAKLNLMGLSFNSYATVLINSHTSFQFLLVKYRHLCQFFEWCLYFTQNLIMCHGIIERKKKKKRILSFYQYRQFKTIPKSREMEHSLDLLIKRLAIFEGLGLTASQASVCGCKGLFQFCFFHE